MNSINLSIADQRVLAVRNYMFLLRQKGLSNQQASAVAEDQCWDAWHLNQVYLANGFKLGQYE
jgi:hypothetical protein